MIIVVCVFLGIMIGYCAVSAYFERRDRKNVERAAQIMREKYDAKWGGE